MQATCQAVVPIQQAMGEDWLIFSYRRRQGALSGLFEKIFARSERTLRKQIRWPAHFPNGARNELVAGLEVASRNHDTFHISASTSGPFAADEHSAHQKRRYERAQKGGTKGDG